MWVPEDLTIGLSGNKFCLGQDEPTTNCDYFFFFSWDGWHYISYRGSLKVTEVGGSSGKGNWSDWGSVGRVLFHGVSKWIRREAMILLVTLVDAPSKVLCCTDNSFLTVAEREWTLRNCGHRRSLYSNIVAHRTGSSPAMRGTHCTSRTNRTEKMEEISSRQIMCRGRERDKIRK
jgi:hypothetical protein